MKLIISLLALFSLLIVPGVGSAVAGPVSLLTVFEVNSQLDQADYLPGDGVCASETGLCTLRAAVMEAAALQDLVQVFLPAGLYLLSIPPLETADRSTGDLDIHGSLELVGAGLAQTVISGNSLDRVFDIASAARVTFSDLTIQDGKTILLPFDGGYEIGGGLRISSLAAVNLIRCSIRSNTGGSGGGIFNLGELNIHESAVVDNTSLIGSSGGGIFNSGELRIEHTLIQGNSAYQGGGIYHAADTLLEIRSSQIVDQPLGGGLVAAGPVLVENTTIRGNREDGGVVLFGIFPEISFIIRNSTISGNTARPSQYYQRAGGITHRGGQLILTNSTVSGNTSTRSGGGILIEGGMVQANNLTITENRAASAGDLLDSGGGIANLNGLINLQNTIVAGNFRSGTENDCLGTIFSMGYNLISAGMGCGFASDPTTVSIAGDPGLGPLQNNGGETETHALLIGNLAIDAGNPAGCTESDERITHDQRGFPRSSGLRCDIGAFEASGYQLNFPLITLQ